MKALVLCFVALLTIQHAKATDDKSNGLLWSERTSLPIALQEIYPARHNDHIYVAGGLSVADNKLVASNKVFKLATNGEQWQPSADLPAKRHHGFLVSHHNDLLLIGGFDQTEQGDWTGTAEVILLRPEGWQQHSTLPSPQAETNVAVVNGKIHIAGGRVPLAGQNGQWRDHIDTGRHLVWNERSRQWENAPALPTPRNSSCSVAVGYHWYVIGGRTVNEGNIAVTERYDSQRRVWETMAPMPQAQGGLACALLGEVIYAAGGEFFDNGGGVYTQVWAYSITQNLWHKAGELPLPRHGLGAVALDNSVVLIGGAKEVGARGTLTSVAEFVDSAAR